MKFKRIIALLLAVVMVFALAACKTRSEETKNNNEQKNNNGGDTYEILVWVPDAAVELTKKQIEDFNKTNEQGITFVATVNPVSESDAATQMLNDVQAGPDLYFFAQDQFARLVRGGGLMEFPEGLTKEVAEANEDYTVEASKAGNTQYAFPLTNDNGYFMYYDKSVIPTEDEDSLEALIADCEKANRTFAFEMDTSAWYLVSFFFGAGCDSKWVTDDDGNFISITDDFNSEKGLIAVKGMEKLVKSPMFVSSSSAAEFANNDAIVVTGTWAYEDVKSILGDNMVCADLPSYNVDGKDYHLGSFRGCKLLGVKPQADPDRAVALLLLGQYLTGEKAQLERFDTLSWGPSNKVAAQNQAVLDHPALKALNAQNSDPKWVRSQGQIEGSWWDIAKVIGSEVKEASSEADLKAALQHYDDKISAVFNKTEEEKNAYSVIGAICGTNWDTDFQMTDLGGGKYDSEELELYKGDEFKFRKGGSWDTNFGSDGNLNGPNFVVETSGKYILHLTVAEGEGSAECEMELLEELPDREPEEGEEGGEEEPATVEGWAAIGGICGTNWDTDFPMVEVNENIWVSAVLELKAGEELKARKDGAWDENMGTDGPDGANLVVEADGVYTVVLDLAEETITIVPAE